MDPAHLLSVELGRHLATLSAQIGRQLGVLINRQGRLTHAFVGDATRIYLPDLGRVRAGSGHFRGLRHVHTVLQRGRQDVGLHRDDFADLTRLRLDAVVALAVHADGAPGKVHWATLAPARPGLAVARGTGPAVTQAHQEASLHEVDVDFAARIADLEQLHGRQAAAKAAFDGRERALVVGVYPNRQEALWRLDEIRELADTAGVGVVDTLVQLRERIDPRFVVGRGKLEEAVLRALDVDAQLLIMDHDLTPAQGRALAAQSELRVIDRTQLILDIFAQHAQSRDGKLQVELAQLKYTLPRLTDLDTGLSRLTGGIGGRGPGETKLEINRRRARDRIARLERQIDSLSGQRQLRRQQRQGGAQPMIAVVGYTNAGKSTLLNSLTGSQAKVADQLFATLDPTSRRLALGGGRQAVVTDTVGFIRFLPPDLVNAFRATLEELDGADLLLHVADCSDPRCDAKIAAVEALLDELQVGAIARLTVLNKVDAQEPRLAGAMAHRHHGVLVSARDGRGMAELVAAIQRLLPPG